jgi:hypothetical protein
MPFAPEPLDPADLCPPEIFEAFYVVQYINDDGIAIMHSKPVINGVFLPDRATFTCCLPRVSTDLVVRPT